MQKVDTDKNWQSQFRPLAHGHRSKFFYYIFKFCFVILSLSFKFQTYILSNGWDSLTNHCFFGPRPRPNRPFWDILFCQNGRKKNFDPNGWKAAKLLDRLFTTEWQSDRVTELQSYRVTESQSHATSTPYTGGWNFFIPIFNKLPYSLRSQGDNSIYLR